MRRFTISLVDDTPEDQQTFLLYSGKLEHLEVAGVYGSPAEARPVLESSPPDLLVLDIHMPGQTGLDFLRSLSSPPPVILTTVSINDSLTAYELGVVDYLVKPFTLQRFSLAVNRALQRMAVHPAPAEPAFITLKEGHQSIRIALDDILYVEAFGSFSKVHLRDRTVLVSHLLSSMADRLPAPQFLRVHRSFIVAAEKVSAISARGLAIEGASIPVGDSYRAAVRSRFIR